jgi:Transposase DDE domain
MQQRVLRGPRAAAAGLWLRRLWWRAADRLAAAAPELPGCHGRRVLVVDGSSVTAPDTHDNQQQWPQPKSQKPGCGFPLLSLVGIFCLGSGALLRAAHGKWATSEARLFALLRHTLRRGDVLVADRGFWSFANLAFLPLRRVDLLVRGRYAARIDWRKGRRLGRDDRLITMQRPGGKNASRVMSARLWRRLPADVTVRQIRTRLASPGFRSRELLLITTLLDPVLWPVETLAALYARRWRVELSFDDLKTTLQTASLRGRSPAMIRRELLLHAIAYNLVRRLMLQSAAQEDAPLDQISFKGSLDTLRHWQHSIAAQRPGRAGWRFAGWF